ncbi:leucine-rich repeat-containing protein 24-like [Coccinella septempunctata]|uniref:leucine-rich repeat-containing protein 24-like n=1 Tax=Coccinella septempunctata TaxID=41139 RepID=UPI001D07DF1E|nr:leucine-rich repeat-containing protein 24-like [Coccinella septempunctata]
MKCRMLNHLILTATLLFIIKLGASCPTPCICKWKYGKQTVECIDKDLLIIPEGMDTGTQVLEFSGNNLQLLQSEKFHSMDLINLQRIHLARCRITSINDRTFKGLTNLVELDLSGNLLEAIPSESFLDCPSLMRLTLSSNPIKIVRRAAFSHLSLLNTLELSRCLLNDIQEGAFQGLYSLEWLHLNENKLATLKGLRYFPNTLKGVQFQDNPWNCDCHLVEFQKYVKETNTPNSMAPICTNPQKLMKHNLKLIPPEELACLPEISPTTFYLEVSEGRNISLICHAKASPEAKVSWWFKGQLIQNDTMVAPGIHLIYFVEDGSEDKRSELFIFNTNEEDNGTFICVAENPAGLGQANFTIRVVLRKVDGEIPLEPQLDIILILISTGVVTGVLLLCILCISIVRCHRNRLLKKRIDSKVTLSNSTKDSLLQESIDEYPESLRGSSKLTSHYEEETELYTSQKGNITHSISPTSTSNQARSPLSLNRYNMEQNPDLINGTDGVSETGRQACASKSRMSNYATDFRRNDFGLSSLNPINLVGGPSAEQLNVNCYKTLPYKREKPGLVCRYSLEAEFIAQPTHLEPFANLRYTADGYPVRTIPYFQPSTIETCCASIRWPPCLPANFAEVQGNALMKCVGAQTEELKRDPEETVDNRTDQSEREPEVFEDVENKDLSDVKC